MRSAPHASQGLPWACVACGAAGTGGSAPGPRLTSANRVVASVLPVPRWDLLGEGNPSWVLLLSAMTMGKARFIPWDGRALQK